MCQSSNKHSIKRTGLLGTLFLSCSLNFAYAEFDISTIESARLVCIKGAFYSLHEKSNPPRPDACDAVYETYGYGAFEESGTVRGLATLWDSNTQSRDKALANAYNKAASLFLALGEPYGPRNQKRQELLNLAVGAVVDVSNPSGLMDDFGWSVRPPADRGYENPVIIRKFTKDAVKKDPVNDYVRTKLIRGTYGDLLDDSFCDEEPGTACALISGLKDTEAMVGREFYVKFSTPPVGFGKKFPLSVPLQLTNMNGICTEVAAGDNGADLVRKDWKSKGYSVSQAKIRKLVPARKNATRMRVNTSIFLMPPSTSGSLFSKPHHKVMLSELEDCDSPSPYRSSFFVADTDGGKIGAINANRPLRTDFLVNYNGMTYFAKSLTNAGFDARIADGSAFWASALKSLPVDYP